MTRDVRKYCFRSTKSLICSVDYDVHPDSGCAIKVLLPSVPSLLLISGSAYTHSCNARVFFKNWILAFIDTRVEPPPAIAPPPQWAAPSCNGLHEPT